MPRLLDCFRGLLGLRCLLIAALAMCCSPGANANEPWPEDDFTMLFNGQDLTGWVGATEGYEVVDGAIQCKAHGGGNLFTKQEYANFVLRFEFKLPPGGNNGIGVRAPLQGDAAYTAMELQVLDDAADQYQNLKEYQFHGSVYGVAPAKRGHLKSVGEWNEQEIKADGTQLTVTLNGTVILDVDLAKLKPIDGHQHPGLLREKGHLGFLGHGSPVAFRNVRIKELAFVP